MAYLQNFHLKHSVSSRFSNEIMNFIVDDSPTLTLFALMISAGCTFISVNHQWWHYHWWHYQWSTALAHFFKTYMSGYFPILSPKLLNFVVTTNSYRWNLNNSIASLPSYCSSFGYDHFCIWLPNKEGGFHWKFPLM